MKRSFLLSIPIIRLKVKLKDLYQNTFTEYVYLRLFTVYLGLRVYVIPFLKSVNTSLFI